MGWKFKLSKMYVVLRRSPLILHPKRLHLRSNPHEPETNTDYCWALGWESFQPSVLGARESRRLKPRD
jgi:hypothetical protein